MQVQLQLHHYSQPRQLSHQMLAIADTGDYQERIYRQVFFQVSLNLFHFVELQKPMSGNRLGIKL